MTFACNSGRAEHASHKDVPELCLGGLSVGKPGKGALQGGVAMPCSGDNYESHSFVTCQLGRSYAHPLVIQTLKSAYAELKKSAPGRIWQVGEIGAKDGGSFKPHRTHQNGLAVDLMMPIDIGSKPARMPSSVINKWGYALDFNKKGVLANMKINMKDLAQLVVAIQRAGRKTHTSIERLIIDPRYHGMLRKALVRIGAKPPRFNRKQAWVRHDEHIHIVFKVPKACRAGLN